MLELASLKLWEQLPKHCSMASGGAIRADNVEIRFGQGWGPETSGALTLTAATPHDHRRPGGAATRRGFPAGTGLTLRRFLGATIACLAAVLLAAPGALAASNITVVPGSTTSFNAGPPTFAPTGANSEVGADLINAQLAAGTDVTLNTENPAFASAGTITVNGNISSAHATGDLTLDADDDISQGAVSITVAGNTRVETTVNDDITLTGAGNDFNVVSSPDVATLSLRDQNALALGSIDTNSNLVLQAGGNVTQTAGSLLDTNHVILTIGSNDVTLTNTGNDFDGFVANSVDDATFSNSATGSFQLRGTVNGTLTVTTAGNIFDASAEPISVAGSATLNTNGNAITLDESGDDFSSVVVPGASNATLFDTNALEFGASTMTGDLRVTAGGPITQTGALTVGGATAASGGPVTLGHGENDFTGAVGITSSGADGATVDDTNDLTLDGSTSGGSLTATADDDLTVAGSAAIAATGALRLVADDANPTAPEIGAGGIAAGANAALTGAGAIRLYGSRRGDNSIAGSATFNGSTFTPGTIFANSASEQWGAYSPAGTATAPFTFFYKDSDASTPQATITTPANGATYERGQLVNADYSCSDGGGGSGIASCAGTVTNGSPIDTSTLGQQTFEVDVTSGSGKRSTSTVTYNVVDTPPDPAVEVLDLERDRDKGKATLTVATNVPGVIRLEETKKVKGFGPVQLNQAGNGELEVVARIKAAKRLDRAGRITVNPRIRFVPAGLDYEIGIRHRFTLRLG